MSPRSLSLYTCVIFLSCASASAWTLIEDFENYADAAEIQHHFDTWSKEAGLYLLPDPTEEDNAVLHVFTGEISVDWANSYLTVPLPEGTAVGPGEVATLYWRAYEIGIDNNWGIGMTDKEVVSEWSHYNVLIKVTETSSVAVHHRRTYYAATPPLKMDTGVWNHFWLVVDYDASTYNLWVKRPTDAAPVQLVVGRENDEKDFTFRRPPQGELGAIALTSNSESPGAPNAGDPWFIDDFYITPGKDLSIPTHEAEKQ